MILHGKCGVCRLYEYVSIHHRAGVNILKRSNRFAKIIKRKVNERKSRANAFPHYPKLNHSRRLESIFLVQLKRLLLSASFDTHRVLQVWSLAQGQGKELRSQHRRSLVSLAVNGDQLQIRFLLSPRPPIMRVVRGNMLNCFRRNESGCDIQGHKILKEAFNRHLRVFRSS